MKIDGPVKNPTTGRGQAVPTFYLSPEYSRTQQRGFTILIWSMELRNLWMITIWYLQSYLLCG